MFIRKQASGVPIQRDSVRRGLLDREKEIGVLVNWISRADSCGKYDTARYWRAHYQLANVGDPDSGPECFSKWPSLRAIFQLVRLVRSIADDENGISIAVLCRLSFRVAILLAGAASGRTRSDETSAAGLVAERSGGRASRSDGSW